MIAEVLELRLAPADVAEFAVVRGVAFWQDGPGSPALEPPEDGPFAFSSWVDASGENPVTVTSATVSVPGNGTKTLTQEQPGEKGFEFEEEFGTQAERDAAYPAGNYQFSIHTLNDGHKTPTLVLPNDPNLNTPHISNWNSLQSVNSGANFNITWDDLGGTGNDFVEIFIEDSQFNEVFVTPDFGENGSLDGNSTSVQVPADTLQPGQTYEGCILFARATTNENVYPGATGIVGHFKEVCFDIITQGVAGDSVLFTSATASVGEGDGALVLTVTRTGSGSGAVSVDFGNTSNSATQGDDYGGPLGTLNWGNGDTSDRFINVPIFQDGTTEGNENFFVFLHNTSGNLSLGSPSQTTVTITDDEPPMLQFSGASFSVAENGGNAIITVSRGGSSDGTVMVNFATANDSALAGSDYTQTSGILTFTTGDISESFMVPITDDSLVEGNQAFTVTLSNPQGNGAVLGALNPATVTITDFEPGTVQFSAANFNVAENGGNGQVIVTRTGGSDGAAVFSITTSNGTATAGSDYTAVTTTVTFANGDAANKTVNVPILNDAVIESNETINLTLAIQSGSVPLGNPSNATMTIQDDEPAQIKFSAATFSMNEAGGNATITIQRAGRTDGVATVQFATSNGTATAGADYTTTTTTVTFNDGESSKTVQVPITDDATVEGNETVNLALSNVTGLAALASPSTSVLTIVENDIGTGVGGTIVSQGIFLDADGDTVAVKVGGPGFASIFLNDPDGNGRGPIQTINLTGATELGTSLSITTKKAKIGGDGVVNGGAVNIIGGLKSFKTKGFNLDGSLGAGFNATGFVAALAIRDVLNGADLMAGGLSTQFTKFTAHDIQDGTDFNWGSGLSGFTAARFGDGSIMAPSIGSLTIRGDTKAIPAIPGDFGADITLSGAGVVAGKPTLSKVLVTGALNNAIILINGGIGGIGSVTLGQMINSAISAGYQPNDGDDPFAGGNFVVALLSINSVTINSPVAPAFVSSFIAATTIGSVNLSSVLTANGGVSIGILADDGIGSVNSPVLQVSNPAEPSDAFSGDFHVKLL